ncbi:MAG TPA: tripartite tricarboxylate transporter substrate binding protein [Burkholderiales bacterium]|nr:tripartite tricarboxylate transporter substrate binding protein [Burkholderiales bacterium]
MKSAAWASILSAAALACLVSAAAGAAQWTPSERIVFVSHSSAGTGNDLMLREIADIWTKNKFVPTLITVENVTGGRSEKARRYVAQQNKGNAHMLLAYTPASLNQAILGNSEYTFRRFTPLAMLAIDPVLLVTSAEMPYKSLKDLVEAARQKPKSVLQGGGPYGNSAAIAGQLLQDHAKVQFSYTPFKGGGEAVVALLGKHVQFIIENPGEVEQHVKAGKMRALAASDKLADFPDVPTFAEAGFPMHTLKQFRAVVAPPGISTEVAQYYVGLLERMRATPQWKDYVKKNALVENWLPGAALAKQLEQEESVYRKLDEQMGLLKKP